MDYTHRAALSCLSVIAILIGVSFIPGQTIGGVELKRVNILSDLVTFEEEIENVELEIDEREYEVDLEEVSRVVQAVDNNPVEAIEELVWEVEESEAIATPQPKKESGKLLGDDVELTPIEDFDSTEMGALKRFYAKMQSPDSLVRVAFLGDSFVEGDILTSDLREALQSQYGGKGCGFAPMASPLTNFRQTIKTQSKGWTSYNVMQRRSTPEPYNGLFPISGWVCRPDGDGSSVQWTTTDNRKHIDSCEVVRLLFVSREASELEVIINDTKSRTFNIKAGEALRQIELHDRELRSVKLTIKSGAKGFVGYGAVFEGRSGVAVDNYSVRSNNGQAMFWTNAAINAQIDKTLGGYDLVVLQYGLNIMQKGVNNYTNYSKQVGKMIAYVRQCFPEAAVVVMGVSDRSMKEDGEYKPMVEAVSLSRYQREAAMEAKAAFWNTYEAMAAQGSMSNFVDKGWAGKDFTHINFNGGRQVAWALADGLIDGAQNSFLRVENDPIIGEEQDSVIRDALNQKKE